MSRSDRPRARSRKKKADRPPNPTPGRPTLCWSYGGNEAVIAFRSRVASFEEGKCWLWTGRPNKKGYGRFCFNWTVTLAHRASYEMHHGIEVGELCVLHHCDTPACVNPEHLFLGTRIDNNIDMRNKGRGKNPPVGINSGTWTSKKIKGEKHPRAKIKGGIAVEFAEMTRAGVSTREMASHFGLTIRHTNQLKRNLRS